MSGRWPGELGGSRASCRCPMNWWRRLGFTTSATHLNWWRPVSTRWTVHVIFAGPVLTGRSSAWSPITRALRSRRCRELAVEDHCSRVALAPSRQRRAASLECGHDDLPGDRRAGRQCDRAQPERGGPWSGSRAFFQPSGRKRQSSGCGRSAPAVRLLTGWRA